MPTSAHETITPMVNYIIQVNPKSILDVGVGFGKYGMLSREYLDVWPNRIYPPEWQVQIDGIEIYNPFTVLPSYSSYYNNIFNEDISNFSITMNDYDLIICGDVIEHMDKERGIKTINNLLGHCRYLLISVPLGYWPVTSPGINPFGIHRASWEFSDLEPYISEYNRVAVRDRTILVALLKGISK